MSAPYSPGGARIARLIGSTHAIARAPAAWALSVSALPSTSRPRKSGCWKITAAGVDVRHHRGLGDRRRTVIKRRVGDIQSCQLRNQGLKLEDRLERALARL